MTANDSTSNAGKSPAPIHDIGDVCTAIENQSNQTATDIRIHQLDGMAELAEHMAKAKLSFPGILFGFLHHERDRLATGRVEG